MLEENRDFAGKNGFTWFIGIVEDKFDPLKLGRCRVRCVGWHTPDKQLIPTEHLPWATSVFPVKSVDPYAPREGDMVFGFFADGENAQEPVVMGVLPNIPLKEADPTLGFNDARTAAQLIDSPRPPQSRVYVKGSGVEISEYSSAERYPRTREPHILDEPTTPRMARNEELGGTFIEERRETVFTDIPKAYEGSWDEPETEYDARYPYNNVTETESGHHLEFDDTFGKERVHLAHRSGTFLEMYPKGDQVERIAKSKFSLIVKDDHVYVMGEATITIDKDARVLIEQNGYLEVKGDLNVHVHGNANVDVDQNVNVNVGGNLDAFVAGTVNVDGGASVSVSAATDMNLNAGSSIRLSAPRIDLN